MKTKSVDKKTKSVELFLKIQHKPGFQMKDLNFFSPDRSM